MPKFDTEDGFIYYEILDKRDALDTDGHVSEPAHADLSTIVADSSPPMITLLHNFMSTGRTAWGRIAERFAVTSPVLLIDSPGHGRSIGYPDAYDHLEMARQIAQLMHTVGAETGHLAGCSSGGMIAQHIVNEGFARPASLTLVSTTYSTNPERTGNSRTITPEAFQMGDNWLDVTAALHDPHQGEGYFYAELLPGYRALDKYSALDLSLDSLINWLLPTCIIHGEEDEFFPLYIPQSMAESIPDATLHIVPKQTHAMIFRKSAHVFDIMSHFLA